MGSGMLSQGGPRGGLWRGGIVRAGAGDTECLPGLPNRWQGGSQIQEGGWKWKAGGGMETGRDQKIRTR